MSGYEIYIKHNAQEIEYADSRYPGPKDFVHLHNHTMFSPLDGIPKPDEYFEICSKMEMPAFAITDHGTMASFPDAYIASKKHNIKFLPGNEFYYSDYHEQMIELQKSGKKISELKVENEELYSRMRRNRHLTVIAMNMVGYRNLIKISEIAWGTRQFYSRARISFDLLKEYNEGLIILSGCLNGPISHELRRAYLLGRDGHTAEAKTYLANASHYVQQFKGVFGDRYYIEHQMPGESIDGARETFGLLTKIMEQFGLKGILTNDTHYLARRDFELQKIMMAINQGTVVNDPDLFHVNSDEQFFKTRAQLRQTFYEQKYSDLVPIENFESYCDNTIEIAERCEGFNPDLSPKLPQVEDADNKLIQETINGLKRLNLWYDPKKYLCDGKMVTHQEQAIIELKRFIEKGFSSYFLITQDLVRYSTNKLGLPLGPGRGSCGGSIVCYALGITQINALMWELSFDRFLSESRGGNMLKVTME